MRMTAIDSRQFLGLSLTDIQLYLDGFLDLAHILLRNNAGAPEKPLLTDSHHLVCQGLAFFTFDFWIVSLPCASMKMRNAGFTMVAA